MQPYSAAAGWTGQLLTSQYCIGQYNALTVEVLLDQLLHPLGQRGAEQHRLALLQGAVASTLNVSAHMAAAPVLRVHTLRAAGRHEQPFRAFGLLHHH